MSEKNKPMTFEEWDKIVCEFANMSGPFWELIFHAARQGMIPADRAIEVPDDNWAKAPKNADSYCIIFGRLAEGWEDVTEHYDPEWFVGPIPRPTPAWTPKVGDAVFLQDSTDGHTFHRSSFQSNIRHNRSRT